MIKIEPRKVTTIKHALDYKLQRTYYYAVYYIPRTSEHKYLIAIFAGQREALTYQERRQKEAKGRSTYYVTRVSFGQNGMAFPDLDSPSPDKPVDDWDHPDDLDLD